MPNIALQRPMSEEGLHQLLSSHPDFSSKAVGLTAAAYTLSHEKHADRTMLLDRAAGSTITLPKAIGSGHKFKVKIKTTATSNSVIVKVGNTTDIIQGVIMALSDGSNAVLGWEAGASDDTITFDRTTTGTAKVGHWIELEDIAAGVWAVSGQIAQSGSEATPFSATVS